jgi:hypothetical protein
MKNENVTPVRVYRDELNEASVKIQIEKSRIALQKVLDTWSEADLGICKDITALVLNPEKAYSEAINENVEVPVQPGAKYQIAKDVYIQSLSIPVPNQLYVACRDARKLQFSVMMEIWSIENEKTIVLNQDEAEKLIDAMSIYCNDPDKKEMIDKLQAWVKITNYLNQKLGGEFLRPNPVTNEFCRRKFKITDKYVGNNYQYEITIDPEFLRQLL